MPDVSPLQDFHMSSSYAVKYAAQSLLCASLLRKQRSPPFGSQVIAQVLGHKKVRYPEPRTMAGRLLYWDHLQDQPSYLLCQPEDEDESREGVVQRAGFPVLSPPETPDPKGNVGSSTQEQNSEQPVDLDKSEPIVPDDQQVDLDEDEPVELDLLEGTPFTYFYPSSEESTQVLNAEGEEDDDVILMEEVSAPTTAKKDPEEGEGKKQATPHISVLLDVVLASRGRKRQKWLAAGKKELDNLTLPRGITALSPLRDNQD